MPPDADILVCRQAIKTGSKSFHAASRLLPGRYRDPALALYAFCRLADDAVDLSDAKASAVLRLQARLDAAYAGRPEDNAADRAFAAMVRATDMPRALPEALIEGLAWDAMGRRYETLSDLRAYSARVAAAVGAMMTVIMGVRDGAALARACDLGVAMQLTNIARDVGEDARAGRLYLPLEWLRGAGIEPEAFLAAPRHSPALADLVARLLAEADRLYRRAEIGIGALPASCKGGIYAARLIYADIGSDIRRAGHDSISRRAHTTLTRKLALLMVAMARGSLAGGTPRPDIPALPETAFLVEATARPGPIRRRIGDKIQDLMVVLTELEARDRAARLHASV
ncbi:MAG: phytoene/squalene synthase family protein [Pseudomonadota bacterium]